MKKNLWNIVMVVAIATILISGAMIVGSVQGWSSNPPASAPATASQPAVFTATAQDKLGSVNIERSGIAYSLTAGSVLRDMDIVETLGGSEISLNLGSSSIRLGQNSEVTLNLNADGNTSVLLNRGEAFVMAEGDISLTLMDRTLTTDSGVFTANAHTGSAAVYLLDGTATVGEQSVSTGEAVSILANRVQKSSLTIQSLNDFAIQNARNVGEGKPLFFSPEQLDELTAQRTAEIRAANQERTLAEQQQAATEQRIEEQRKKNKNALAVAASAASSSAAVIDSDNNRPSSDNEDGNESNSGSMTCSIEIRCDSILQNMENLAEGKEQYVPTSGKILERRTVSFSEGDTVFDVLKSACREDGIQLEYSHSPVYDSYYIEGINNLYEFDCGGQSGWMYKVNGWFPNYSSSAYPLKDGDTVVWGYVCAGYEGGF